MKRIKSFKIFMALVLGISLFSFLTPVNAKSATVGFTGNSTVSLNNNITIKMYVNGDSSNSGGIVSVGGNLSFDNEYLEYVSSTGITSPYTFQINTSNSYKIAGLDTTLSSGITTKTTVFTFVFKAIKTGSTQITFTNAKLTDTDSVLTTTVSPMTITITNELPSPTTSPSPTIKSSDATLKNLSVSGYTLSPSFNKDTTSYTIKVPHTATKVKIEGSTNDSNANISGLGEITLTDNNTTATIKVTAEDGTVKTYTIKIEKEEETVITKSSDATLKSLDVAGYTLTPTFKSSITTYSMKVKNNITSLNVTAIPNDSNAKVEISGNKNWKEGNNTITIKVTAEDGTINNYIVNVDRASSTNATTSSKSSDNYLKSLTIKSSHEMEPTFSKNVNSYNVKVPYEVEKLDLTTVLSDTKAKVEITGNENFKVGAINTVEITVTAEDGSIRVYSLNVTRSTQTSNTDLKDLVIDGKELSPKFDKDTLEYTINVDSNTNKLNITATPSSEDSTVEIIGNSNFKEGHNTVLIKVTDSEGFTKYYTIDVVKEAKEETILGLSKIQFGIISGIIGLLLLFILILLLRRKKDKDKEEEKQVPQTPIIEVKPEFNFGSKNSSDDDVVHGDYNQRSKVYDDGYEEPRQIVEASYEEMEDKIPYDPYDETVTKKEIIDAIHEATRTKDTSKLKMLLEQDALNQKKKELRKQEEKRRRYNEDDDDDWR